MGLIHYALDNIDLLATRTLGYLPAVIAVMLFAQLPIIRNTPAAIHHVDPALREAARGIGMSANPRLHRVEIPLAAPMILAGDR